MALSQDDLLNLGNNPTRGVNLIINEVEQSWNNGTIQLNSKAHPAILCVDLIIGTTHGFLNRLSDACSKTFLLHARNVEDLSRNIADEERYGLFANPSTSSMWFAINVENLKAIAKDAEIQDNMVTTRYKKVLIPKDTMITVTGYDFLIENGIEIRYNERTGYQVVYDASTNNPFNVLSTNLLEREFREIEGRKFLMVKIPVRQLSCAVSDKINSTESSGCSGAYSYTDYLYGVRAFLTNQNNQTTELRVSYDQDTFDPLTPTLALKLDTVNNTIRYEIPDVYISNGMGIGTVTLYTYTTKGELVKDLTSIEISKYQPNYLDFRYPGKALGPYSMELPSSGGIAWQFADIVSGGSNPIPFTVLKESIIAGRRQRGIPITDSNLSGELANYGYGSVRSVDLLTARRYSVTKELPIQSNKDFHSTMNCFVGSHLTSVNTLIDSGVVYDNSKRVTIPPGVLFDVSTPTTVLINQLTKNAYMGLSSDAKVELVSNNTLVYIPFYYVFDLTNNQTVLRTYHLDEPKFMLPTYIGENPNLGLEVGVGEITINHTDTGYEILLKTKSGKGYKQLENANVGVQLSFATEDSTRPACIAGELMGTDDQQERVWRFKLESSFDVDVNNLLVIKNMHQFGVVRDVTIQLTDELSFIFTVSADTTVPSTSMDERLDQTLFTRQMMAIIETRYKVQLGAELTNIYSRIRPLKGDDQYQRYDHDVPDTYEQIVYQRDDKGKLVLDVNKRPIIEHNIGEPKYTSGGSPIYKYRANVDYVIGADGQPVLKAPADLLYHWDFIAFDGAYFFSNDSYDQAFAQETKDYFIKVITKDMEAFNADARDRTSLYYQPKSKIGYRNVMVNNNYETVIRQDLAFQVVYYLNKSGFNNTNLKESLRTTTPQIINNLLLSSNTLGMSDITEALKKDAGGDVVDVKIGAFAGDTTLDVVSNLDSSSGFSVRKLLETGSNGLLSVKEAVEVSFLQHDVSIRN
ncbi:putative virion structural protein [Erwinia phage vB_EamM_Joad]|uniref:Putative virion structural protein n=1 Tax=Erwinia phage vB_EamM_Joad TaxID=2026081 RepID=A0A223LI03_9CAUD|nr:putative virion structural protein [Erwinia phage vB_EamM_Joad]